MARGIIGSRGGKDAAPCGSPQPVGQHVGFAHGPQIPHQGQHRGIADRHPQAVGDRQRQSGALHQAAEVTDLRHRCDARAEAPGLGHLGRGQRLPQLAQRLAAEENRDEETVRPKSATALDELAHRVVRPVQTERMNDEIEAVRLEAEDIAIGDFLPVASRFGQVAGPDARPRTHDGRVPEGPVHRRQPLLNLLGRPVVEEVRSTLPNRPLTAQREGVPVEERRRLMHSDTPGRASRGPSPIAATLSRLGASLIDTLYPPRCLACSEPTDAPHGLCPACWRETDFIAGPACRSCGLPLLGEAGPEDICEGCQRHPPAWNRGSAAFLYRGAGREMVLAFKHGDRLDLTRPLARWMAQNGRPLLDMADLIVPVPLHWRRLLRRRYNQSAELAKALSRLSGTPTALDLLVRTRSTGSQEGRNRSERFANQAGAFRIPPRHAKRVAGRRILLVDDVLTTGGTLSGCAETLAAAGASEINVIVVARVAFEDSLHI